MENITQEDLDSGKVVKNKYGIFWFKKPGKNTTMKGQPIKENLHREDGPAEISFSWWLDDNPTGITRTGWWLNGVMHRIDGPAAEWEENGWLRHAWFIYGVGYEEKDFYKKRDEILNTDITKMVCNHLGTFWFKEAGDNINDDGSPKWNNLHKEDGPAAIFSDHGFWYKNGKLHCESGPAITYTKHPPRWFLEGIEYSEEEFNRYGSQNRPV